jgi:transposase
MMEVTLKAERIFVASHPCDFRKEINGLCALVVEEMKEKPVDGIYVFYNRARNRIKILGWHGNGFGLFYKRMERGKFVFQVYDEKALIDSKQLEWLIAGLDWRILKDFGDAKFINYF